MWPIKVLLFLCLSASWSTWADQLSPRPQRNIISEHEKVLEKDDAVYEQEDSEEQEDEENEELAA